MLTPFSSLQKLLGDWAREKETALLKMGEGKNAGQRLSGYSRSKRVDAKFLLLAFAPFLPIIVSDQLGWSRNAIWYVGLGLSAVWAIGVSGVLLAVYWRAIRRSIRRKP